MTTYERAVMKELKMRGYRTSIVCIRTLVEMDERGGISPEQSAELIINPPLPSGPLLPMLMSFLPPLPAEGGL